MTTSPNPNPVFQLQFFADAEVTRAADQQDTKDEEPDGDSLTL